ncbi:MAG: PAS domain-containing protein [Marinicella sp.]|nr:PAS domain-containing protein [Xanthomonadales bacterium]
MRDMTEDDVTGDFTAHHLTYFDGTSRRVLVTDEEVPFPEGKLIVSRTDPTGIITHCNKAFVEMSGFSEEELIGQPHHILRHPDMPKAAFKDVWDTAATGAKWHGYVKNLRKDGKYYWVYATVISNVRNGEVVGFASVRRKPSRTKINECVGLYKEMLAEEQSS